MQLGNHVLGGAFYATRFYRDLRENEGLVYYVGSSFDISKTRGSYQVSFACDPDKVTQASTIIVRDLKQMQDSEVTPKELTQAKALLLREIRFPNRVKAASHMVCLEERSPTFH